MHTPVLLIYFCLSNSRQKFPGARTKSLRELFIAFSNTSGVEFRDSSREEYRLCNARSYSSNRKKRSRCETTSGALLLETSGEIIRSRK